MTPTAFCEATQRLALGPQRAAAAWYGVTLPTLQDWRRNGPTPVAERLTLIALALVEQGMPREKIDAMMQNTR